MDYVMGIIRLFPYTFAPLGWMLCNGQMLQIQQYSALFSLIGNTYGGDGTTNFALPNLLGTEPIPNVRCHICVEGIYPVRD